MTGPSSHRRTFSFEVEISGIAARMEFTEVSGLGGDTPTVEVRNESRTGATARRIPALHKFTNLTLKRGLARNERTLLEWLTRAGVAETGTRTTLIIRLVDEAGHVATTWTVANARPVKFTGPSLSAAGNDLVVESLEIACEGITSDP